MKECEQIGDLFGELHDQGLESEIEKAAREHLRNCPGCREEFKWYGITVQALTQLERVNPPEHFLDQLNVRLQTCSPTYSFRDSFRNFFSAFPQLPVPVGVACLSLAVAVAWGVYRYNPIVSLPTGETNTIAYATPGTVKEADLVARGPVQAADDTSPDRIAARVNGPGAHGRGGAPSFSMAGPHAVAKSLSPALPVLPASNQTIGSDNLTVESPSINVAVESLKKLLPDLHGTLVEEKTRAGKQEAFLAVRIPPQSWPHLTTELISHGAVAVASADKRPQSEPRDNRNVLIRIRIVNTP